MQIPEKFFELEVTALLGVLRARGYVIEDERYSPEFSHSGLVVAGNGTVSVRVVRDRAEWWIDVRGSDWDRWFSPEDWRAMLTDTLPPEEQVLSFAQHADLLLADLDEIERLTARDAGTFARLAATKDRMAAAHRAFPVKTTTFTNTTWPLIKTDVRQALGRWRRK